MGETWREWGTRGAGSVPSVEAAEGFIPAVRDRQEHGGRPHIPRAMQPQRAAWGGRGATADGSCNTLIPHAIWRSPSPPAALKSLVPKAKKARFEARCPTVVTHLVVRQEGIDACSTRTLQLLRAFCRR